MKYYCLKLYLTLKYLTTLIPNIIVCISDCPPNTNSILADKGRVLNNHLPGAAGGRAHAKRIPASPGASMRAKAVGCWGLQLVECSAPSVASELGQTSNKCWLPSVFHQFSYSIFY